MSQAFFEPLVLSASSSVSLLWRRVSMDHLCRLWRREEGRRGEGEKKDFDEIEWEMSGPGI